jgi:hypothetical protein
MRQEAGNYRGCAAGWVACAGSTLEPMHILLAGVWAAAGSGAPIGTQSIYGAGDWEKQAQAP